MHVASMIALPNGKKMDAIVRLHRQRHFQFRR
jgi:hypothetical protein